ncbi:hypothetical protein C8Q76DRAFT_620088 [Earliella scabrosa]|nr:hypothetical protein C8Q76DRAFT_620088 [Earliella scabrosa]
MDIVTLIRWRATCHFVYGVSVQHLSSTLVVAIESFFPAGQDFLQLLTECHGVIGGLFALGFILRDSTFSEHALDIFVTHGYFQPILDYLAYSCNLLERPLALEVIALTSSSFQTRRAITRYAIFRTSDRRTVSIYESSTMSPCAPICRSWTGALVNFVTAQTFGCAYPRLTFQRRGLLSTLFMESMTTRDRLLAVVMRARGFTFAVEPSRWEDYVVQGQAVLPRGITPCYRDLSMCPDQARFFGDRGSLIGLYRPLSEDFNFVRRDGIAPFGHMTVWRLWSSCVCDRGCSHRDPLLPPGLVFIMTLFTDSPFFSCYPLVRPVLHPKPVVSFVGSAVRGRSLSLSR